MKKLSLIFLVFCLIFFTAFIKNSTKRIDDEIFVKQETIRALKKDYENIKLEHNYLSSSEKLSEFKNQYFENLLIEKDIKKIKVIKQNPKDLKITNIKFFHEK